MRIAGNRIPCLAFLALAACRRGPAGRSTGTVDAGTPVAPRPGTQPPHVVAAGAAAGAGLVDRLVAAGQASKQYLQADAAMAETWSSYRARYGTTVRRDHDLRGAQRAWIAFRDRLCELEGGVEGDVDQENRCLVLLTDDRRQELAAWLAGSPGDAAPDLHGKRMVELPPELREAWVRFQTLDQSVAAELRAAPAGDPLAAKPMAGPFATLDDYCGRRWAAAPAPYAPRAAFVAGRDCDPGVEKPDEAVALPRGFTPSPPLEAVRVVIVPSDGTPGSTFNDEVHLAVRLHSGWFVSASLGDPPPYGDGIAIDALETRPGAAGTLLVARLSTHDRGDCGMGKCEDLDTAGLWIASVPGTAGGTPGVAPRAIDPVTVDWQRDFTARNPDTGAVRERKGRVSLAWSLAPDGHLALGPCTETGDRAWLDSQGAVEAIQATVGTHALFP